MSILKEIYDYKINYVEKQKLIITQSEIQKKINISRSNKFPFYRKLANQNNNISIIGELKRASPSVGTIVNESTDLVKIANLYEANNIACLSILTDEKYFKGSMDDLVKVRENTNMPILRKDFIVDEYQIYESKLIGSDCILIILSMLNQKDADKFSKIAKDLELDTILEVHNIDELNRAMKMESNMIGINNRNLNNFYTDINTTINLYKNVKNIDKLLISESGINGKSDIKKIHNATGINNFLIGEYLMKSKQLENHINNLLN